MNVLIYDEGRSVARLVRSLLLGLRHRCSISTDPEEARLKISTALFDALVIGPAGAPRALADFVDREFAWVPIVLAGMDAEILPTPRIHAALRNPLSPAQFITAINQLRRKLEHGSRIPEVAVDIVDEDAHLVCKATKLSRTAMMLEGIAPAVEGLPDEFSVFFGAREAARILAAFRCGETTVRVPARVAFAERSPAREVRLVGVRFDEQLAEPVLQALVA